MMRQANGVDVLGDPENVKQIGNILKTNVAACVAIGPYFLPQLGRLWVDMLGLYGAASNNVSTAVAEQGKLYMSLACGLPCRLTWHLHVTLGLVATRTPKVRALRTIKKEILKLVETYIKRAEDLEGTNANLIPGLLEAVLGDYSRNVAPARDAEVLNLIATIVGVLGVSVSMSRSSPGPWLILRDGV
jgi:exportin-1